MTTAQALEQVSFTEESKEKALSSLVYTCSGRTCPAGSLGFGRIPHVGNGQGGGTGKVVTSQTECLACSPLGAAEAEGLEVGRRAGCALGDPGDRCALLPRPNTAHSLLWTTAEDPSEMPTFSERVRGLCPQVVRQVTRSRAAEDGPGKRRLCLKTPTTPCGPAGISREPKVRFPQKASIFKILATISIFYSTQWVKCPVPICHLWLMPLDVPIGQGPSETSTAFPAVQSPQCPCAFPVI